MIYDIIIIGGGISGLYSAYKLSKKYPSYKIIILEKRNNIGGRIYTYNDKYMHVEAGAGRFSTKHTRLIKLLEELGLKQKIKKTTKSGITYIPSDYSSLLEYKEYKLNKQNTTLFRKNKIKKYNEVLKNTPATEENFDKILNSDFISDNKITPDMPNVTELLFKVVNASKMESPEKLRRLNFLEYSLNILHKTEMELIKDSFGYYSELVLMNCYDCINLIETMYGEDSQFCYLNGGLSQLIEKLGQILEKNSNIKIAKNYDISAIVPVESEKNPSDIFIEVHIENRSKILLGRKCICALPKQELETLDLFRPIKPLLRKIKCGSLCRIYTQFDRDKNGELWFEKLTKFTTNNLLRMVIPYDYTNGTIMISYTDNKFADYWNKLYSNKGIQEVNNKLHELLLELFEGTDLIIPYPKHTKVFYWGCGVGYWGLNANSKEISESIIQPFEIDEIFVCGEHYSEKNQQWMEGALETADKVVSLI